MEKEIRSYFEKNFPDQFKEFNNLKQKQIEKNLQKQVQDAKIEEKEETYIVLLDGGEIIERSKEFVEVWDEWE